MGISKQAVHQQQRRKQEFDNNLSELLIQVSILRAEHPGCGLAKMYKTLQPDFIGRDRFIEIMQEYGYRVKKSKNRIKTTYRVYSRYENLIEGILLTGINQVLQSDISYILIGESYCYLVFIMDVYSKRIVGYQVSDHLRAEANLSALRKVIRLRGKENLSQTIHHSDRGSQYIATNYIKELNRLGCSISMGDKAQQNAYAERINGTIKNEYLNHWSIKTIHQLKKMTTKAVNHYNKHRKHNHLPNGCSPIEFERKLEQGKLENPHFELIFAAQNAIKRKMINQFIDYENEKSKGYFCPYFLT